MLKTIIPAAAVVVASLAPSYALEVSKSAMIDVSPATVWKTIGQFCHISAWHPAIENCKLTEKGGKPVRTLSLKGGGTLVEEEQARDDRKMDYTYTILEGPLPVSEYRSTIMVTPEGKGSRVTWSGSFQAKGADDAKARDAIAGIYDAGLKGIADKAR